MQSADRKLAYSVVVVLAVIAFEAAWFLLVGPAYGGSDQATGQEAKNLFLGISAEGWTAMFTGVLTASTVLLWVETRNAARAAERNQKTVERAYLFFAFQNEDFTSANGTELEIFLTVHNSGKTPGMIFETYGQIVPALPRTRSYTEPKCLLEEGTTIPPGTPQRSGSVYSNTKEDFIFGYIKYRDVFGFGHTTGFALWNNPAHKKWEIHGGEVWNYSD